MNNPVLKPAFVGRVESIHVIPKKGAAPEPRAEVLAIAGRGLDGHHHAAKPPSGKVPRELTLIEGEVLEELAAGYGFALAPGESRRNLVTRDVRLNSLVGKHFRIGTVLCLGMQLCEPCSHLEKLTGKSLRQPLLNRGGLRAQILFGGKITVGAEITPG